MSKHLEEVTTQERIDLVQGDKVRRWGQIIIAFVLIFFCLGYLAMYTWFAADAEFKTFMANAMLTLAIAGIGAAFAIFGLGRTVGRTPAATPPTSTLSIDDFEEDPQTGGIRIRRRLGKDYRTGVEMDELFARTKAITKIIRKINESDNELTPQEQNDMIEALPGLTAREMEAMIPLTGPELAKSIRDVISKHRATDRTTKDQS